MPTGVTLDTPVNAIAVAVAHKVSSGSIVHTVKKNGVSVGSPICTSHYDYIWCYIYDNINAKPGDILSFDITGSGTGTLFNYAVSKIY